jgi:hypothetical protein
MAPKNLKKVWAKQKPLWLATVGAFESLAVATAVIFFNSSRTIKGITTA